RATASCRPRVSTSTTSSGTSTSFSPSPPWPPLRRAARPERNPDMQTTDVIKRPLILTEKGSRLRDEQNQYLFEVDLRANKHDIRRAAEDVFEVSVVVMNTLIVRGKQKRLSRRRLKTRNWKKAMITPTTDDSIEFFEGAWPMSTIKKFKPTSAAWRFYEVA